MASDPVISPTTIKVESNNGPRKPIPLYQLTEGNPTHFQDYSYLERGSESVVSTQTVQTTTPPPVSSYQPVNQSPDLGQSDSNTQQRIEFLRNEIKNLQVAPEEAKLKPKTQSVEAGVIHQAGPEGFSSEGKFEFPISLGDVMDEVTDTVFELTTKGFDEGKSVLDEAKKLLLNDILNFNPNHKKEKPKTKEEQEKEAMNKREYQLANRFESEIQAGQSRVMAHNKVMDAIYFAGAPKVTVQDVKESGLNKDINPEHLNNPNGWTNIRAKKMEMAQKALEQTNSIGDALGKTGNTRTRAGIHDQNKVNEGRSLLSATQTSG